MPGNSLVSERGTRNTEPELDPQIGMEALEWKKDKKKLGALYQKRMKETRIIVSKTSALEINEGTQFQAVTKKSKKIPQKCGICLRYDWSQVC